MPAPLTMLENDLILLGPLRRDLLDTYQRWMSDLAVTRTLAIPNMPMTLEAEQAWLDHALTDAGEAVFTMYRRDTGQPIGNAGLHNIDHFHRTSDFGIAIGERSAWNLGFGTSTTRLLLSYGFDVLGLRNIMLEVYATNPAALRAYERAGFRRIGVRRSAYSLGRERTDIYFMDAVPEDFPPSDLQTLLTDGPPRH
jgi:diamine N-acetyltransferase